MTTVCILTSDVIPTTSIRRFHSFVHLLVYCFWLLWAFVVSRGLSLIEVHRLLIVVASLVVEHGIQVRGLQQLQLLGSAVVAYGLQGERTWRI